jgi:hypothetical protein
MRALMFDGTYEDQRGTEPLLWQIVPSDRYGRMRWYEIRTKIRGVEIWGRDFDGLGPDDPDTARAASLPLDPSDVLTRCVLTGDPSVVVDAAGQRRDSMVSFSRPASRPGAFVRQSREPSPVDHRRWPDLPGQRRVARRRPATPGGGPAVRYPARGGVR